MPLRNALLSCRTKYFMCVMLLLSVHGMTMLMNERLGDIRIPSAVESCQKEKWHPIFVDRGLCPCAL